MKHQREHWGSKLGFIMAAIGSQIGLGTLWMLPYVTGENGGGLFVLIYLGCVIFIGLPVFITELVLGRRSQRGVVGTFASLSHKSRNWQMVGWLSVATPVLILSYYLVVAGWGLNYVFLSLSDFTAGSTPESISGIFDSLQKSGSISMLFTVIFGLMTTGMIYQGIQKGIEYWAKIMTIGLLIILLGLICFCATLDGFGDAVRFIFSPDASKLTPSGVLAALGLGLFTLSLGHGVMVTYASYMHRTDDIPRTAIIVVGSDILISILVSLMIFPIVFTFGFQPEQGAGLVFKTLPVLFGRLPGSLVISTFFFILFVFTALTSTISMFEVAVANFMDLYSWSRKKAALICGGGIIFLGIPCAYSASGAVFPQWELMYGQNFFDTVAAFAGTWLLPLVALFTCLFAGWGVARETVEEEFRTGTSFGWLFHPWRFFIRYVIPCAIIVIILQQGGVINVDRWFGVTGTDLPTLIKE